MVGRKCMGNGKWLGWEGRVHRARKGEQGDGKVWRWDEMLGQIVRGWDGKRKAERQKGR